MTREVEHVVDIEKEYGDSSLPGRFVYSVRAWMKDSPVVANMVVRTEVKKVIDRPLLIPNKKKRVYTERSVCSPSNLDGKVDEHIQIAKVMIDKYQRDMSEVKQVEKKYV